MVRVSALQDESVILTISGCLCKTSEVVSNKKSGILKTPLFKQAQKSFKKIITRFIHQSWREIKHVYAVTVRLWRLQNLKNDVLRLEFLDSFHALCLQSRQYRVRLPE